jgi:DNA polymerase I-like protein with 3'-5' exonuclease and polymerase domains
MLKTVLVDRRNVAALLPTILDELRNAKVYGLDCETQDRDRHEGLNVYNNATRLVFDHRRTVMTGFSTFVEGSDTAYYFNLAHADEENRLGADVAEQVIEAGKAAICVAHNAPFELVMFFQCLGIELHNVVCTLQMAVSHHGPDEYDLKTFYDSPLPVAFHKVAQDVIRGWDGWEPGSSISGERQELLTKFIAKESKAAQSYNGFVDSIGMGYGLKKLTKSRFNYDQVEFKALLAQYGARDMGDLTGEQVCAYGADDAYWAVQHYRWMFDDMLRNNPPALNAFFNQENPMIHVYADSWREGIRLDLEQVFVQRDSERKRMAETLRRFKANVRACLPFPDAPHKNLLTKEKWYSGTEGMAFVKKRKQITDWATSHDAEDDFEQCFQVSNPIGNAWAEEKGVRVPSTGKLNLVYYHGMRTLMYDLMRMPLQYDEGSVASDKEARGRIREHLDVNGGSDLHKSMMADIQMMADIEQRMKLYLTPYTQLMDPETSRVYPSLSSKLATRRLATSFPNPMQLAKQGDSAYIRSFYLGDDDDCVVVSADWSAIELVLIGDFSGDEGFSKVYGQLPYGDMHSGAAVDALSVKALPGLTEEEFREFKFGRNPNNRVLKDFSGRDLTPSDFHKFARGTAVGKGVNFSYWYSGALSTVANNLSLTDNEHWELVDNYRQRFPAAEAWRVGVQDSASINGYVTLPDGHRRNRFEATGEWRDAVRNKFTWLSSSPALLNYADTAIRRLWARARNQAVNAMIQGSCATLAKRSILTLQKLCADAGLEWGKDYRLMMPIHDELVWSVRRSCVMQFIALLRQAMTNHPDLVTRLPLHCTVAIGRTFRPFNKADPKLSQIELDEAQFIDGVVPKELEGTALPDDKVAELLDWIFT